MTNNHRKSEQPNPPQQPSEVELRKKVRTLVFKCAGGIEGDPEVDAFMELFHHHLATEVEKVLNRLEESTNEMGWYPDGKTRVFDAKLITDFINQERNKLKDNV